MIFHSVFIAHIAKKQTLWYAFKMKLKYLAYNFEMPAIEKKGKIITPEFEHGRIIVREHQLQKNKNVSLLTIMKRPNDESENKRIFRYGYLDALENNMLGHINLIKYSRSARFAIDVHEEERSKGYGTVLMNAGAKNCRDSEIETMQGIFSRADDWERRLEFYEKLGIPVKLYKEIQLQSSVNNPLLNKIQFEDDKDAAKVLNSLPSLQLL